MPIIGATELQPVNILGSYVQGLEGARQSVMQRAKDEAALAEAQRAAELRNFARTADFSQPEQRNKLSQFGKPGLDLLSGLEDIATKRATAEKTGLETLQLQQKLADENYGRFQNAIGNFAYGDKSVTKAAVLDKIDEMIAANVIRKEFRPFAERLPDDPVQLQEKLRGQFLSQIPAAERAKLFIPVSPEVQSQALERARAGRSTQSITNIQERAESGAYGTMLVDNYKRIAERADTGRRALTTIDQAQRALNQGLTTGFGAETIRQGARVLAALGEPESAKNAANADLFLSSVKQNVLSRQQEQKGTQTESDAQRIEDTFIGLGKTPAANQFLLDVARAVIKRDDRQQRFYQDWRRKNGSYDGAEEAWLDGEGGTSLFDSKELKQYATAEGGAPPPPEGFKKNPTK
jgi:hypothetical protein